MKILNIGACHIDHVYSVEHIVRKGETTSTTSLKNSAGGKGLNQSIALAKAGATVYQAGCIGEDGMFLKDLMEQSGVDTSYLKVVPEKTGHAIIQVDEKGENSILLYDGADTMIDDAYVESVISRFEAGDYLILQNEIGNIAHMVDCAYERGMKIIFNPSPYNDKIKEVDFHKLSWIIVNEVEARDITDGGNPMEAFRILKQSYPNLEVVVTLGKRGCLYTDGDEIKKQRAYEVSAVDTTGAGDTFTGYFFAGVAYGKSHSESAKQAAIASALSTTKHGAASSIPCMEEVLKKDKVLKEQLDSGGGKKETAELIEAYIEKHLDKVTLEGLARELNYSSAYTSRWIRQYMNISYNELVQKKRCEVAADLLKETDMPIGEIISRIGYHNESFFREKFSSIYGKKPKQYRECYKKM